MDYLFTYLLFIISYRTSTFIIQILFGLQTCLPHAAVSQPCMSEFNKKHTQRITEKQTQRFRDSFILRIG